MITCSMTEHKKEDQLGKPQSRRKFLNSLPGAKTLKEVIELINKHPKGFTLEAHLKTIIQMQLFMLGEELVTRISQLIPNPSKIDLATNQTYPSDQIVANIRKQTRRTWFDMVVVSPIREEALFRMAPSFMLDIFIENEIKLTDTQRTFLNSFMGLLSSSGFAFIHTNPTVTGHRSVPVGIFMGGCFLWYLMRYRGLSHAYLAHMYHNQVSFEQHWSIAQAIGKTLG